MNNKQYRNLSIKEWRHKYLSHYERYCETPEFDKFYDLSKSSKLYDLFYPLGIHDEGIESVSRVCGEFIYATEDDGDLSLVQVLFSYNSRRYDCFAERLRERPSHLMSDGKFVVVEGHESFVMRGDYRELVPKLVEPHLKTHSQERCMIGFYASRFNNDALNDVHSLLPDFDTERRLGGGDAGDDDNTIDYYAVRKKNDSNILKIIRSRSHVFVKGTAVWHWRNK